MTKMTKKAAYMLAQEALSTINTVDADRAWTVLQNEIDRLEKAALKAKTYVSKADKERAAFRTKVEEFVTGSEKELRAAEVAEALGVNTQKASAALTSLVKAGTLFKKNGEKRTILYTAIAEE